MKLPLTLPQRILLAVTCFVLAIIGFMVKLPSGFRHYDKELHTLFYFLAAAFLNVLFAGRKLLGHVIIFVSLYLFSIGIEHAQAYSNKYYKTRIHGRFDPEDVHANLIGLVAFSVLWLIYVAVVSVNKPKQQQYD